MVSVDNASRWSPLFIHSTGTVQRVTAQGFPNHPLHIKINTFFLKASSPKCVCTKVPRSFPGPLELLASMQKLSISTNCVKCCKTSGIVFSLGVKQLEHLFLKIIFQNIKNMHIKVALKFFFLKIIFSLHVVYSCF